MVSDLVFNPYASVLITHRKNLTTHRQKLGQIVRAAQQGWISYLKQGEASHQLIHQHNPQMGMDILTFGHQEIQKLCSTLQEKDYGLMNIERWQTLIAQMEACGLIKKNEVKAEQCFNNDFLEFNN